MRLSIILDSFFRVVIFVLAIAAICSFSGCGGLSKKETAKLIPAVHYAYDARIWITNTEHFDDALPVRGYGVADYSSNGTYWIKVKSHNDKKLIDQLTFASCSRDDQVVFDKAQREVKYEFTPTEDERNGCPLEIYSLSKEGKHSWGKIFFQSPDTYSLPAWISCGGIAGWSGAKSQNNAGVSACMARDGSLQSIRFDDPVEYYADGKCATAASADNKKWSYHMPNRDCEMLFKDIKTGAMHLLYLIGWEKHMYRGSD